MPSKIILVDLDGPLADLESGFLKIWRERFPNEFFIPVKKRATFKIADNYPENLKEKIASILEMEEFFANLSPVPGGIETMKEMVALGYKVFICTADIYRNKTGLADKRSWVRTYLGHDLARTMILTRDKTLVRGHYLIDDNPIITGALSPEWEHVIFDQPYNGNITDKKRIKTWSNWKEVIL